MCKQYRRVTCSRASPVLDMIRNFQIVARVTRFNWEFLSGFLHLLLLRFCGKCCVQGKGGICRNVVCLLTLTYQV